MTETPNILIIMEETKAAKAVDIWKKAPDFKLNDVHGNRVTLSSRPGTGPEPISNLKD